MANAHGMEGRTAAGGRPRPARALLSVVVPCFNEHAVIVETHRQISAALDEMQGFDFEFVYIDDGSEDGTLDLLRDIQRNDSRVRVIALSRNFGHQVAIVAGLHEALGDAVAVIDADLQDPPSVIADLAARWRDGVDVAYGERTERAGETNLKTWTAWIFYRLVNKLADAPIPFDAGDFRIIDRQVVDALLAMPERDLMVRGMTAWAGFRQEAVPFRRAPRHAGETKYSPSGLLRLAMDGMLSFSRLPLRIATWAGALAVGASVVGLAYALAARLFTGAWVSGWAAVLLAVLFIGGAQMMLLGLLGEYVGRIYGEVKRRPLYFVKERLGSLQRTHQSVLRPTGRANGDALAHRLSDRQRSG